MTASFTASPTTATLDESESELEFESGLERAGRFVAVNGVLLVRVSANSPGGLYNAVTYVSRLAIT
jgi:hypothetical protein